MTNDYLILNLEKEDDRNRVMSQMLKVHDTFTLDRVALLSMYDRQKRVVEKYMQVCLLLPRHVRIKQEKILPGFQVANSKVATDAIGYYTKQIDEALITMKHSINTLEHTGSVKLYTGPTPVFTPKVTQWLDDIEKQTRILEAKLMTRRTMYALWPFACAAAVAFHDIPIAIITFCVLGYMAPVFYDGFRK